MHWQQCSYHLGLWHIYSSLQNTHLFLHLCLLMMKLIVTTIESCELTRQMESISPVPLGDAVYDKHFRIWWRHQMETFAMLLVLRAGYSPVRDEFPSQRPVMRSCDVFFDLRLNNKGLSKNRDAGDLRRHCAHFDVSVMIHPLYTYPLDVYQSAP